jgi:hypothetical protein
LSFSPPVPCRTQVQERSWCTPTVLFPCSPLSSPLQLLRMPDLSLTFSCASSASLLLMSGLPPSFFFSRWQPGMAWCLRQFPSRDGACLPSCSLFVAYQLSGGDLLCCRVSPVVQVQGRLLPILFSRCISTDQNKQTSFFPSFFLFCCLSS